MQNVLQKRPKSPLFVLQIHCFNMGVNVEMRPLLPLVATGVSAPPSSLSRIKNMMDRSINLVSAQYVILYQHINLNLYIR